MNGAGYCRSRCGCRSPHRAPPAPLPRPAARTCRRDRRRAPASRSRDRHQPSTCASAIGPAGRRRERCDDAVAPGPRNCGQSPARFCAVRPAPSTAHATATCTARSIPFIGSPPVCRKAGSLVPARQTSSDRATPDRRAVRRPRLDATFVARNSFNTCFTKIGSELARGRSTSRPTLVADYCPSDPVCGASVACLVARPSQVPDTWRCMSLPGCRAVVRAFHHRRARCHHHHQPLRSRRPLHPARKGVQSLRKML